MTRHHSLERSSYVSSRRDVTPSAVLPTSSPKSLYTLSVVRETPPAVDVTATAREVLPSYDMASVPPGRRTSTTRPRKSRMETEFVTVPQSDDSVTS